MFISRLRWRAFRPSSALSRSQRVIAPRPTKQFRPTLESLEDRTMPAPLTGGTGPGGFILVNGTSNLTLWYDATAASTVQITGGKVTGWLDRSGYANNATQ